MSEIIYREDIHKEIAEELDLSETEVADICNKSVSFLYKKMQDPTVISIQLPMLGVLHFNKKKASGALKNERSYFVHKDLFKEQISVVDKAAAENPRIVHNRRSIISRVKRKMAKSRSELLNLKKIDVYEFIEKKQNK